MQFIEQAKKYCLHGAGVPSCMLLVCQHNSRGLLLVPAGRIHAATAALTQCYGVRNSDPPVHITCLSHYAALMLHRAPLVVQLFTSASPTDTRQRCPCRPRVNGQIVSGVSNKRNGP